MIKKNLNIFIFSRDLRLHDNLGLNDILKNINKNNNDYFLPIFILDENQIVKNNKNKYYFSSNAVQFICYSLMDLNEELIINGHKLCLLFGDYKLIIDELIKKIINKYDNITIGFNKDYSKYAIKRDEYIINKCNENNIKTIINENDLSLFDLKNINKVYKQFSAFYKKAINIEINKPKTIKLNNLKSIDNIKFNFNYDINKLNKLYDYNENISQIGGRINGINKILYINDFKDYESNRNYLDYNTTNISAYLNIGCISCREVYHKIINNTELSRSLYWRDFYLQLYINDESFKSYNNHSDNRFDDIKWKNELSKDYWSKMINSQTGYLLIDAAMNELKKTGFMHNRARLLVANFWIKYLLINPFDLKYGSQTGFSKYLVDAIGSTQNKMNHHWITELDYSGRRYSVKNTLSGRKIDISNKQIKKYDPNCIYIKKWIPELKDILNKELYKWDTEIYDKYKIYYAPIFNENNKYEEWINATKL